MSLAFSSGIPNMAILYHKSDHQIQTIRTYYVRNRSIIIIVFAYDTLGIQ